MEENKSMTEDDGSLAFLGIPPDPNNDFYNCEAVKQQQLTNREFWVTGFKTGVKTKYKPAQTIVHIMFDLKSKDSERKFFTGSKDIKYVLDKIKEMDKFPRKVTMRCSNNRFFFE